jgi:GNAT superfamily N-acetyltransferase
MNRAADMPATVHVRDAIASDLAFLVESNAAMALETERKRLDSETLMRGVAGVLQAPARGFYLIAERDGQVVGCLLVTREWSDWRNGDWWWLQSVHVVPAARRLGVFRALHAEVERRARDTPDVIGVRLYVEGENRRAQATYRSFGMNETGYRLFERLFPPAVQS